MGRPVRRVPGVGLGGRGRRADAARRRPARSPRRRCRSARCRSRRRRFRTSGVPELDRVLGGGLVPGAAILLAGEPGVGKSTLLLEVAAQTARVRQPRPLRHRRGVRLPGAAARRPHRRRPRRAVPRRRDRPRRGARPTSRRSGPTLLVVDSIQTIGASGIEGVPGGVTQVKEVAAALIRVAKTRNITTVLVGHVTKDGSIAGPRVLEHLVDVVLHFEGDRNSRFRMVRAMKNRFGPVDEVGCFDLGADGHHRGHRPDRAVRRAPDRPGARHLRGGDDGGAPAAAGRGAGAGHALAARAAAPDDLRARLARGWRWCSPCSSSTAGSGCTPTTSSPRRSAAPGSSSRPATWPSPIALASATLGVAPPSGVVAMGEIGLAGELRRVRDLPQRLAEAARLGFRVAVVPSDRDRPRPARRRERGPSTACGCSTCPTSPPRCGCCSCTRRAARLRRRGRRLAPARRPRPASALDVDTG